jgi:hypothetical protein
MTHVSRLLLVLVAVFSYGASPANTLATELEPSGPCASHYQAAPAQSAVDGKTLVAIRMQEQHTKLDITSAVSDFERSLSRQDTTECKRQLANARELSFNGAAAARCQDLMESAVHLETATKPKLRNEIVEVTFPEARVSLDAFSSNEHHTYLLEEVHDKWVIRCFASSPLN